MSDSKEKERKKLSLGDKGTLSLKSPPAGGGKVRQTVGGGRSKNVAVEVKRKRGAAQDADKDGGDQSGTLTDQEREARIRALQQAQNAPKEDKVPVQTRARAVRDESEDATPPHKQESKDPNVLREQELAKMREIEDRERAKNEKVDRQAQEDFAKRRAAEAERMSSADTTQQDPTAPGAVPSSPHKKGARRAADIDDEMKGRTKRRAATPAARRGERKQRGGGGKLTVTQALNKDYEKNSRMPSLAAQRRAREKERMRLQQGPIETVKQVRDVTIPEAITVQELANRMAERVADVVKKLMEMDVMVTATQSLDADTAELIVQEFGHTPKRVSAADVEIGIEGEEDTPEDLKPRPPVVTVMGHVDHGKTSLLDAMRASDVASGEAGGITQHIGAYQVTTEKGQKITFIDTPGHAAFTEMRARGADVTDIVILVVAADDSIMPQTIEAISHAKAAEKPLIVAINKCDLPDANPDRVRQELLQHEIMVESMGGETQCLEVSAKNKQGLEELEEAILLQSEILELKANPDRDAKGTVVEAKLEQGRGSVATVLVERGTLKIGDVFVTGCEFGKVRALINDRGKQVKTAIPGQPIEVLGLNGTPDAGDDFVVVGEESKARQITEFRNKRKRDLLAAKNARGSLEQMMDKFQKEGDTSALPVIIKGDVHGSVEAISSALQKLVAENDELAVSILHTGVGGITESDVTLANASNAMIIGFNVRANAQARELANRDDVNIQYYSVIYDVIDEVKSMLGGLLSPVIHENFIGYAEIRQVFSVSKTGKVAGCMVTEGIVKRGAKVRLLRDDVVIHEGALKTLRRFKDEVKEVREGFECGMAFESYDDIKDGDVIEVFELEERQRSFGEEKPEEKEKPRAKEA